MSLFFQFPVHKTFIQAITFPPDRCFQRIKAIQQMSLKILRVELLYFSELVFTKTAFYEKGSEEDNLVDKDDNKAKVWRLISNIVLS